MSEEHVRRCTAHDCTGPDGEPRRLVDDRRTCPGCALRGHAAVTGLPTRYVALRVALTPGTLAGERVRGPGFVSRAPVREAALAAMDEMSRWAARSEREVRGVLGLSPRVEGVRPAVALVKAVVLLAAHWDHGLMHPAGVAALNGAIHWQRRCERVLGWDRLIHRLPAPCPYCDTLTLIRRDGDDRVRCRVCRRSWLEPEYRHFVRMLVEEVT